jgi:hypothetical protein
LEASQPIDRFDGMRAGLLLSCAMGETLPLLVADFQAKGLRGQTFAFASFWYWYGHRGGAVSA